MIDFVYPYITGPEDGIELRHSIGSVNRFYGSEARVWVYGDHPKWLDNMPFVVKRNGPERKDILYGSFLNTMEKLKLACEEMPENKEFVWMNDDMYFLRRVEFDDLRKPRAKCDAADGELWFKGFGAGRNWVHTMTNTISILKHKRMPCYSYETHLPRVYERDNVLRLLDKYMPNAGDVGFERRIFMFATMYYNHFTEKPLMLTDEPDFKLAAVLTMDTAKVLKLMKTHKVMVVNQWRGDMGKIFGRLEY